ncbi:hypothetical protein BGZ73_004541, partial [Actinomortierella ambigua]
MHESRIQKLETDDGGQVTGKGRKTMKSIKTNEKGKFPSTSHRRPKVQLLELADTMVSDDDGHEASSTAKLKE